MNFRQNVENRIKLSKVMWMFETLKLRVFILADFYPLVYKSIMNEPNN